MFLRLLEIYVQHLRTYRHSYIENTTYSEEERTHTKPHKNKIYSLIVEY